jgi:hypothetical protein
MQINPMRRFRNSYFLFFILFLLWSCKKTEDGSECWQTITLYPGAIGSGPDTTDVNIGDTAIFALSFHAEHVTQFIRTEISVSGTVYTYLFRFRKYCKDVKGGDWIAVPPVKFSSDVPGIFQLDLGGQASSYTKYVRVQ